MFLKASRKPGKSVVAVECVDLGARRAFAVALPEFEQRRGLDRAFEMQMQFGLGKKSEKTIRRPIECGGQSLLDCRVSG